MRLSNIFVWIILGLLIVGLMGFGIGNFSGSTNRIGAVGEADIMVSRYVQAYRTVNQSLARSYPFLVGTEQLSALAARQALGAVTRTAALANEADRVGLSVGDETILDVIRTFPAFLDSDGGFSADFYQFYLTQNGLTSAEFEKTLREEEALSLLVDVLTGGVVPRETWLDPVVAYQLESRNITWAEVTDTMVDAAQLTASTADLRAYYQENPDEFTIPSYRAVTYAWITPEMISDPESVTDGEIRTLYDERIDAYVTPERRVVSRLVFPTLAAASDASARIASGARTFDEIVVEQGIVPADIELGAIESNALGSAAADVFASDEVGVVGPVESEIGPAIFNVTAILNAVERPLSEVRADLLEEIARQRAAETIEDQLEGFNDLLAEGVTLEELAETTTMQLATLFYDDGSGSEILNSAAFRQAAATVTAEDYPEIIPLETGGAFSIRLDEITDERLMSYEEAEADIESAWRAAAIRDRKVEVALRITETLGETAAFADEGFETVETSEGITRERPIPGGHDALNEQAFAVAAGDAGVAASEDRVIVFRVDAVNSADNSETTDNYRRLLESELVRLISNDVLTHYAHHIVDNSDIDIDQGILNSVNSQIQSQYAPAS